MADRYLLESGAPDGYLLEDGTGVLLLDPDCFSTEVLADGPVAWWRLGESAGTNAAEEIAALDGTYTGGFTLAETGGLSGEPAATSVLFNGTTGFVSIPADASLELTQLTIVAIVNANSDTDASILQKTVGGSVNTGYSLFLEGGGALKFRIKPAGAFVTIDDGGAMPATGFVIAHATYDGTNMRLYEDGVLVAGPTACGTPTTGSGVALIAGSGGDYFANGWLQDVIIFGSALSADRIAVHAAARAIACSEASFDPAPFAGVIQTEEPTDWMPVA